MALIRVTNELRNPTRHRAERARRSGGEGLTSSDIWLRPNLGSVIRLESEQSWSAGNGQASELTAFEPVTVHIPAGLVPALPEVVPHADQATKWEA